MNRNSAHTVEGARAASHALLNSGYVANYAHANLERTP